MVPRIAPHREAESVSGPFRVLIVTNAYAPRIGGISRYLSDLVSGLEKRGVSIEVSATPESFNRLDEGAKGSVLWWRSIHLLFVTTFVMQSLRVILRLRKMGTPLIVHSHSASFCLVSGVISKLLGSSSVHTFHSPLDRPSALLRALAPKSDALVFVSRALQDLYEGLGVRAAEIRIIPGGVDTSVFHPPSPPQHLHAREKSQMWFGRPLGEHLVLFVGRVVPEKGVHVLLAACQEICHASPNTNVLIIGPFDQSAAGQAYMAQSRAMIQHGSLQDRVALSGPVSPTEVLAAFQAADVLVCPSTWPEPAAVVVSEAMACGLPVVASRVGGLHERVDDGVTGLLIPPNDPHALAQGVLRVLADRAFAERLSRRARSKAVQDLGLDRLIERHLNLYSSVLSGSGDKSDQEDRTSA